MSQGYTKVEYNGIELVDCQTLKFEQQPIYDASGQTHQFERYTVRITGYFLAQQYSYPSIQPQVSGSNSAGRHFVGLREKLNAKRKSFKMTLGFSGPSPQVILEADPLGLETTTGDPENVSLTTDVANGPTPQVISVQHIASDAAIRIEWEVVIHLLPKCDKYSVEGGSEDSIQRLYGVLSNRWSCTDDIDENYWTTRTWQGEMKLAHPCRNPHDFRGLCIPEIQPGMRREKLNFIAAEDGLTLRYHVIDKEVWLTAPIPAHSIRYQHKEATSDSGTQNRVFFSVTVAGDRTASKRELLQLAIQIVDGKLHLQTFDNVGLDQRNGDRILSIELAEESGTTPSNAVTMMVNLVRRPRKDAGFAGAFKVMSSEFGRKIDGFMIQNYLNTLSQGNRPGESPVPYGPIPMVGAFTAFLQSPCTDDRSTNAGLPANDCWAKIISDTAKDLTGSDKLPDVDGVIVPIVGESTDSSFSDAHNSAIYQTYNIDVETNETTLICQMPVAVPGGTTTVATSGNPTTSSSSDSSGISNPLPVSGSSSSSSSVVPNSVFVRVGPAQYTRTVRIVAERHGKPPRMLQPIPAFTDADGVTNVLIGQSNVTCEPTRSADGEARNYIMRVEYQYGLSGAPRSVRFGAPDYDSYESAGDPQRKYYFSIAEVFSSHQAVG